MKFLFYYQIYTEIEISATKEIVFSVITNLTDYKIWNPHIYHLDGNANEGNFIKIILHWPDLKSNIYYLKITEFKENEKLSWTGIFKFPGLLNGNHSFVIKETSKDKVLLIHKESFSGILVPIFKPWLKGSITKGFININNSLKHFSENLTL